MELLTKLATIEAGILLGGLLAVVAYRLVIGEISLAGLLYSKEPGGRAAFSPTRLQLLIFTAAVAAIYLGEVIAHPRQDSLPHLPLGVVVALGGSQAVYVGGKMVSAYIQPLSRIKR
ncbi:MAG TPA: hypothetical protein VN999_04675 [Thermoanaerobaculia bacterium]|nr:hypothetical protein [Thermoanaerobaculia bacterium]